MLSVALFVVALLVIVLQTVTGVDLNKWGDRYVYFVFYSSLVTNVFAIIESWAHDNFPGSKFAKAASAMTDLVSRFAALNWRDKLMGKPSLDRRNGSKGLPLPPDEPKSDSAGAGK
jgi:hypothetical protein